MSTSSQISLRIHNVKCVDETGGSFAEKFGNDEIFLGGFGIDGNGHPVKVKEAEVYKDFDDGDVKTFNPPRHFVGLSPGRGGATVTAGFLLVEQDEGGMDTALDKLYAKVVEELNKKKQEEVSRRRVAGIAALDGLDIDWGAIWKVVAPIVIAYVKDKLLAAFSDDPFPLQTVSVVVPASGVFSGGSKTSPQSTVEIRGNDGIYTITYDWQLL